MWDFIKAIFLGIILLIGVTAMTAAFSVLVAISSFLFIGVTIIAGIYFTIVLMKTDWDEHHVDKE